MLKNTLVLVIVTLFIGCVGPQVTHNTSSGKVEKTYNSTANEVRSELINKMVNEGYLVKSDSPTTIIFEKTLDDIMSSAIYGSKFNSTPSLRITTNVISLNNTVRVIMNFAIITNPGSAFENVTTKNNSAETVKFQEMLNNLL